MGASDSDTVSIIVNGTNQAPIGVNDHYVLTQNSTLIVAAPGVLINDSDAEKDPLTAILVDDPAHGTLVFHKDGSFTYIPGRDFIGTDSFAYIISDGDAESRLVTVLLTVDPAVLPLPEVPTAPIVTLPPVLTPPPTPTTPPTTNLPAPTTLTPPATLMPAVVPIPTPTQDLLPVPNPATVGHAVVSPYLNRVLISSATGNYVLPAQTHVLDNNIEPLSLPEHKALISSPELWQEIEKMRKDMQESFEKDYSANELTVHVAAATGLSLTAGIVAWLTRAGSLVASLLTALPAWKNVDPFFILANKSKRSDQKEEGGR